MTSGICKSAALAVSTPEHLLSKVPTQAGLLFKKQAVKRHHHKHNLKHRYEFFQTLGKGTYGKVKKAIDRSGRAVAIKSIRKDKIKDELDLIHIRREIEIMSSLNHPNIISIYEVFENKDKIVIVMEYASKGDLYDYISERQRLTEQEARHFFRQIVSAVYYCHKNGIVHRDLKLENILLDANGNIKIADFGLSNLFQHDKYLQTFCGSPLYASPEIVNGRPYKGPEVDSWSLGVLLYTLVHGAMPFNGQDYKVLVNQISSGEYKEPTSSSDASGLIRWMLMVNPERRATIDDIANHWWVNWGYKTSICETESHLAGDSPLATIAEWLRRSSRPLFENGSKVRCFFKQHTSGSTLERQRSLKKSKKENDVSHTLQDTTDPKSALKRPKGILKKKSNYEPKPQSGNIPLVVEPKKDNTVLPPTSSAVSQTVYPPEGRNKMTDAKTPSAPKKGILKKPQLRESGYYSSLERSESQEMLDYDKDEVTDSIFENEDGPVTETSQRKGILKRNGKFSSSYKDAIDDAVGMTFGPLDEFTFNKSDLAPRRTHPSSAISDDSILSTESFDQLDLPKQVPCRRNMRGCISAENLLQFDENEMDYRPRLWSMQCYQSRIGDSTFSLTDFDNVTEVYKKAMQINVKLGCGLAR